MNLVDLYYILKSEASRKEFAARCKEAGLKFVDDYTQEVAEMSDDDLEPLLGRFLPWIQNPVARRMIGFREGGINIPQAIDDNKIIIVRMGSEPRELKQMLGMAVIRRIWSRIRSRANESIYNREPFYLFVDEFDNIALADETIPSIISESRSYRLSLNIANQYPKQLPGNVVDAITTNCDTIISFNPGDLQSAQQYATQLGVDPATLTDEVNYHVWLRTTISDNMEKSDAFRAYVYPPHPPKRIEDEAEAAINNSLKEFGRVRRSDEETYANLLFNGGGGKWETGIGAQIEMAEEDEVVQMLEAELRQKMPGPENPSLREQAVFDDGDIDDTATTKQVGAGMTDAESVVDQQEETILEAIFAAAVQENNGPGGFIPTDRVTDELEYRLPDNISVELAEVANSFEQLSAEYVERERISGEQQIRLTKPGQAKVFDQDTGDAVTGGGEEHRWVIRKAFAIFTKLGYITERPQQDGTELPDGLARVPFDFTDVDPTLPPNKKLQKIEQQREQLIEEKPAIWNLSKGNDISIESETTTIETPMRMLTNLRKAIERGNTCAFVTKEGEDDFTKWAERGEKNIYETEQRQGTEGVEIKEYTPTFRKAIGNDGIPKYYNKKRSYKLDDEDENPQRVAVRPATNKRGSVWYHDEDTDEIVCAPSNGAEIDPAVEEHEIRFDSVEQIAEGDPTAVPAYYVYDKSNKQYKVNHNGRELIYHSTEELNEDWETFNGPLIPEVDFPEEPTEDDWVFIIVPDADNDEYDQPQIYEKGTLQPLFDTIGADVEQLELNTLTDDGDDPMTAASTRDSPSPNPNQGASSNTPQPTQSAADGDVTSHTQTPDDSTQQAEPDPEANANSASESTQQIPECYEDECSGREWQVDEQWGKMQCAVCGYIPRQQHQDEIRAKHPDYSVTDDSDDTDDDHGGAGGSDTQTHSENTTTSGSTDQSTGASQNTDPAATTQQSTSGTQAQAATEPDTQSQSNSQPQSQPQQSGAETTQASDQQEQEETTQTTTATGAVGTPDITVTPGELADAPDFDIPVQRLGQIGNGLAKASDEEFEEIYRRIVQLSPETAAYVTAPIDLVDAIETGGGKPSHMQRAERRQQPGQQTPAGQGTSAQNTASTQQASTGQATTQGQGPQQTGSQSPNQSTTADHSQDTESPAQASTGTAGSESETVEATEPDPQPDREQQDPEPPEQEPESEQSPTATSQAVEQTISQPGEGLDEPDADQYTSPDNPQADESDTASQGPQQSASQNVSQAERTDQSGSPSSPSDTTSDGSTAAAEQSTTDAEQTLDTPTGDADPTQNEIATDQTKSKEDSGRFGAL